MLLHGRGADEHDLYPLLDVLDPGAAASRGDAWRAAPPPARRAHWYALGGIPTPDPETFLSTAPRARRLPRRTAGAVRARRARRVLAGHGDDVGHRPRPRAAATGRCPRPVRLPPRVPGYPLDPGRLAGVPVAVAHGTLDPVIPAHFGARLRRRSPRRASTSFASSRTSRTWSTRRGSSRFATWSPAPHASSRRSVGFRNAARGRRARRAPHPSRRLRRLGHHVEPRPRAGDRAPGEGLLGVRQARHRLRPARRHRTSTRSTRSTTGPS